MYKQQMTLKRFLQFTIYIDFWAQLQEEIPDIGRINNLGFKILDSVNQVQEQWNRLKRLNQKASKLNRLMGKYYSQILNDDEMGQKLIQLSRMNQNDKFKAIDLEEISNEQLPTITILTDVDKLGTISNLNKAACSLLGYAKTDLVNRKLNLIQPDLFSKYYTVKKTLLFFYPISIYLSLINIQLLKLGLCKKVIDYNLLTYKQACQLALNNPFKLVFSKIKAMLYLINIQTF